MEQRFNSITISKTIGIVLVVLAHSISPEWILWNVIYTFHIPLFFLLSGYCFKEKYLDDAKTFVWRKFRGIYVPFVIYSLIFLAFHNLFCDWHIYTQDWYYDWKDYLWVTSEIITRMSGEGGMLGMFWFLKELFLGNLFFYCVLRLCRGNKIYTIVGLVAITILFLATKFRVPYFSISATTLYAASFIAIGYAGRSFAEGLCKWWVLVLSAVLIGLYVHLGTNVSMGSQDIYSILPYTITAIGGTICVLGVSNWLNTNRRGAKRRSQVYGGSYI